VPFFDYNNYLSSSKQITIKVDSERISAGFFTGGQSTAAAMVADVLLVAGGREPVNFPTPELHDQVGCLCLLACVGAVYVYWRVCGRVCLSHYDGPLDRGSPAYRAMWEHVYVYWRVCGRVCNVLRHR
jgi:hypothetical protein